MQKKEITLNGEIFSSAEILNQVQKILEYPLFSASVILTRFRNYIINESISGRSLHLKEYNIAISVLKKAADFNTNQSGVVRVHARRLRDALKEYYVHNGIMNCCEIIIPKGGYVPIFRVFEPLRSAPSIPGNICIPLPSKPVTIGIIPFKTFETDQTRLAMTYNIGQRLSCELSRLPNFSTLSYYSTQQLHDKHTGIKEIASVYGIHFVLTGSVQFESARICVSLQLIYANSAMMIWSDQYLLDIARFDLFEIEKVIVDRAMAGLKEYNEIFSSPFKRIVRAEFRSSDKEGVIDIRQNRRNKKTASL